MFSKTTSLAVFCLVALVPVRSANAACSSDTECFGGQYCIRGRCTFKSCKEDKECEGARTCKYGQCKLPISRERKTQIKELADIAGRPKEYKRWSLGIAGGMDLSYRTKDIKGYRETGLSPYYPAFDIGFLGENGESFTISLPVGEIVEAYLNLDADFVIGANLFWNVLPSQSTIRMVFAPGVGFDTLVASSAGIFEIFRAAQRRAHPRSAGTLAPQ